MAVVANGEYKFPSRDRVENYYGHQLLFACWDHHMLMAAPFMLFGAPDQKLGDIIEQQLKPLMQPDPDFDKIDWDAIEWTKSGEPWTPDFTKTIKQNGLVHKEQFRFKTPGLSTLVPPQGE